MGTSAAIAVCLAAWGIHPSADVSEETVDLIEINHFHDAEGRPVFDQILFYDWSPAEGRYQLRDWRLLKSTSQIPLPSARDREFVTVWNDFKARDTLRATRAKVIRETWTQYDPELVERDFLPENKRRKLKDINSPRKGSTTPPAAGEPTSSAVTASAGAGNPAATPILRPLQSPGPRER